MGWLDGDQGDGSGDEDQSNGILRMRMVGMGMSGDGDGGIRTGRMDGNGGDGREECGMVGMQ